MSEEESRDLVPVSAEVVLNYSPSDDSRIAAFSMAENLKKVFQFYTPAGDASPCWAYQDLKGIWVPRGKEWIEEIVTRSMAQHFKSRILNEVIRIIRFSTRNENVILGGIAPSRIVMANGVFDMDTGKFSPEFNPDDYQLVALPYGYDANADCPRFKQFLKEVCPNEEDQMALVEFMGYCLVHHHRYHTFIVLVGNGENGKSKFLGVLKAMLGPKNVTGISLQHLAHNRFMAARLVDKLANICPDIPPQPVKYTGIVKALTGEDLITVEHKHQDSFEFENHAKLLFSANEIPRVEDTTDAWFRRVRIIEFPNQFLIGDKKRDPDIGEKLAAELQGVFNFTVEGWQRLKEQGGLTGARSTEENRIDYLKRSNPLQYFVYQFCRPDPEVRATVAAVYDCYRRVAIKLGKVPITKNWFSTRLLEMLDYVEARQMKIGHKTTRIYAGLKIDLELLSEMTGPNGYSICEYQGGMYEYSILICKNAVSVVTDPDQRRLTPNGDPAKLPKPKLDSKKEIEIRDAKASGHKKPKKTGSKPESNLSNSRKSLPRDVKKFENWLAKLPNAGQRGFKESEAKAAHGEGYLEQLSKYVKKGWIEQRADSAIWWLSDAGKAALREDGRNGPC